MAKPGQLNLGKIGMAKAEFEARASGVTSKKVGQMARIGKLLVRMRSMNYSESEIDRFMKDVNSGVDANWAIEKWTAILAEDMRSWGMAESAAARLNQEEIDDKAGYVSPRDGPLQDQVAAGIARKRKLGKIDSYGPKK